MENKIKEEIKPVTMTAKEAAKYIGISYWLLLNMVKREDIPFIKCGNRKLFRKLALDNWMDQQEKLVEREKEIKVNKYGVLRKIDCD